MNVYDERGPPYLETDMSGVGLGAGLLQIREGMTFSCTEARGYTTLYPIAFSIKRLSSADTRYSNIK